jgi:hypothetical protein
MPRAQTRHHVDRFLRHATIEPEGPTLGRIFAVTRETWALSDDPQATAPRRELLASRRTAADAADFAREAAEIFPEHGFHKPSGAWWGSEGVHFHRFVVHVGRKRTGVLLAAAGLVGVAGLAAVGLLRARRRPDKA